MSRDSGRDDSIVRLCELYPSELTEAEEKNRHVIHYFIHLWTSTNGPLGRPPCLPETMPVSTTVGHPEDHQQMGRRGMVLMSDYFI